MQHYVDTQAQDVQAQRGGRDCCARLCFFPARKRRTLLLRVPMDTAEVPVKVGEMMYIVCGSRTYSKTVCKYETPLL